MGRLKQRVGSRKGARHRKNGKRRSHQGKSRSLSQDKITWFHSIELGNGVVTKGFKSREQLLAEATIIFRHGVEGKTVLDIGAWDGGFSFEAERRGASDVLATDHFCWSGPGWGTKAGFNHARRALGSKVRSRDVDVPKLSKKKVGAFDVTLLLGVLYHVKDPFTCLERVCELTRETLIVETVTLAEDSPLALARYIEGAELNNDATNFWALNVSCMKAMLRDLGFPYVEATRSPNAPEGTHWSTRHIFHAFRQQPAQTW